MLDDCANIESCSNRMASVALIVCCLVSILEKQTLRQDATAMLLEMLTLTVDVENKSCPEIEVLLNDLPDILRSAYMCLKNDNCLLKF